MTFIAAAIPVVHRSGEWKWLACLKFYWFYFFGGKFGQTLALVVKLLKDLVGLVGVVIGPIWVFYFYSEFIYFYYS